MKHRRCNPVGWKCVGGGLGRHLPLGLGFWSASVLHIAMVCFQRFVGCHSTPLHANHKPPIPSPITSSPALISWQWVHQWVVVEGGQVGVLRLDVHAEGLVVHGQAHFARPVVVQVGERNLVLGADGGPAVDTRQVCTTPTQTNSNPNSRLKPTPKIMHSVRGFVTMQ